MGRACESRPLEAILEPNRTDRLVGGPQGLQDAYDVSLLILQGDIDSWIASLPSAWPYSINLTLRQAPALMNLFIVALEVRWVIAPLSGAADLQFTFQRSLLWPTSPVSAHVTFRPSRQRWVELCSRAEQAVYWMQSPDGAFYLDTWSCTSYPACRSLHVADLALTAVCCVIIFHKALEESKDPHHKWLLELADGIIQQWAKNLPEDKIRQKMAALSTLLSSTASVDLSVASLTVQDLLWTDPGSAGSGGSGTDYMEQMGFNAFGLDPMWFENV